MPDRDQLYQALRNADAAGDVEGAKRLAAYIGQIGSAPDVAPKSAADQVPPTLSYRNGLNQQSAQPAQAPQQEPSFLDKVTGGIEAARSLATGATTGALGYIGGALGGIAGSIATGEFGTDDAVRRAKEGAEQGAASLTYDPKTQLGREYTDYINKKIEDSGIVGVPIPELDRLARSLPIERPYKSASPVVAPIDYDIPAYQRNGTKPLPTAPVEAATPAIEAPILPPSKTAMATAPIDAYARAPIASPYGELSEPIAPTTSAPTGLDEYAARARSDMPVRSAPLNQFDDALREAAPSAAPMKSPLDSMIAGESPAAKITAPLRDTSDIDATLAAFGVETPAAKAIPPLPAPRTIPPLPAARAIPAEAVERSNGPAAPIDAGMVAPEPASLPPSRVPGQFPVSKVEQANGPAVPLDDAMRTPVAEETPFVPTPEQHVDPAMRSHNLDVLREIGLDNKRISAVEGNAAQAAREYQHGKFDEPAGHHWDAQFKAETDAMKNYGQSLVDDTKGRTGLDSESLELKGRDIAAPYDAARKYFEDAKDNLYKIADQRAKESGIPVQTASVDALLASPDFTATLMAKDQQGLLNTIKSQYERFKGLEEGGLSVANAENFRKWLNKVWSPDKSGTLGEVKAALDADVFRSAGQDVYDKARQMHQIEKATLDDPNGISKLMDADPRTPMNRATPYEAIPNAITRLSNDQFKHIIDTYNALPPALQPVAQQAIATLKAHYAERLLNAGTETARGNPRGLWDVGGVDKFLGNNSGKLPLLFNDAELHRINTIREAGQILRVNPAYPGAAAQAANASKAGLMTQALGRAGGGLGGLVGAAIGGPAGAAVGGIAGEATAGKLSRFAGERKALAAAKEAIVNEHSQMAPKSAAELFEDEYR